MIVECEVVNRFERPEEGVIMSAVVQKFSERKLAIHGTERR